jgi:hypothetical protein
MPYMYESACSLCCTVSTTNYNYRYLLLLYAQPYLLCIDTRKTDLVFGLVISHHHHLESMVT